MNRLFLGCMALAGTLLVPAISYAEVSCTREGLQEAVDLYVAAQTKGDRSSLPLAKGLGYIENFKPTDINEGLINKPMKIDHQRSLLDTATCRRLRKLSLPTRATRTRSARGCA